MPGPNEKKFWTGFPNRLAAALRPTMILSYALIAGALHPVFTSPLENAARNFGLQGDDAVLASFSVAALISVRTLWTYLVEVTTQYILTSERLIIRHGLVVRTEDEVELYRVIDAIHGVNVLQRLIGVGTVTVTSTDKTGTVLMRSIKNPGRVRNGLRKLAERCKSRRGIRILE